MIEGNRKLVKRDRIFEGKLDKEITQIIGCNIKVKMKIVTKVQLKRSKITKGDFAIFIKLNDRKRHLEKSDVWYHRPVLNDIA
eukprot:snap_masked-scaffold_3-processed-gene-10.25-mRNA-1 protein AED:1.00 eAED:1.00 QI:0/0/0/0/1/1/2/0/82